jgi:transcriptional regulator GlxA family with amidase domain
MLVTAVLADAIEDVAGVGPTRSTGDREEHALRRAEEYLRAHVAAPVALAHVAEAAGVSIRTLSRAFRKHHGMGPIRFLATLRFEAAKSALLAASPEETSVTRVALAHGFASLGRFAVQYRLRFGESPSQTLSREAAISAARFATSPPLS